MSRKPETLRAAQHQVIGCCWKGYGDNMKEIWKDIAGYEGMYQVSSLGNVKSIARVVKRKGQPDLPVRERILKQGYDRKGYRTVVLRKEGKLKSFKVHRLVAFAFIPNIEEYPEINHKDENKQNNNAENLEWCTNKYNVNFGTAIERRAAKRITVGNQRKTQTKKRAYKTGFYGNRIAMCDLEGNELIVFDCLASAAKHIRNINCASSIAKCCKGVRKTAYGHTWRYK